MMDFIKEQANAWSSVVDMMLDNPTNTVLNGSVNGPGSSIEYTHGLRAQLPALLQRYKVTTMLDAPCGDMTWIARTDLSSVYSYIGMDVERRLIDSNKHNFRNQPKFTFICANLLTRKKFPQVDLILSRDFLAHLTTDYILHMVNKYRESGSTYLLASNYEVESNDFTYVAEDYAWYGYLERPHDLTLEPFNLERIDGITEMQAPGGVIARPHELGLFRL